MAEADKTLQPGILVKFYQPSFKIKSTRMFRRFSGHTRNITGISYSNAAKRNLRQVKAFFDKTNNLVLIFAIAVQEDCHLKSDSHYLEKQNIVWNVEDDMIEKLSP